jgi:hypothetical protein
VVPTHDLFNKPFQVKLTFEERSVPENYRLWPGGDRLGKTMKMWRVQRKKFPEIDPGLVSDPYAIDDYPDAEVLARGQSGKGPEAVAIGRHGNFLLWGFSAQPSDMTAAGRACFLNAVCYIKRFDGRRPAVAYTAPARRWALAYAGHARTSRDEKYLKQLFPEDVWRQCGNDPEKYARYYQENLEFLRWSPAGHFVVDEEVKGLGLSNRDPRLLDRCVGLMERGEGADLALRVLRRYTRERFTRASAWRNWLDKNRARLCFTDSGGYKFLVVPPVSTTARPAEQGGSPRALQAPRQGKGEAAPGPPGRPQRRP